MHWVCPERALEQCEWGNGTNPWAPMSPSNFKVKLVLCKLRSDSVNIDLICQGYDGTLA